MQHPLRLLKWHRDLVLFNLLLLFKIVCFHIGFGLEPGTIGMILSSLAMLLLLSGALVALPPYRRLIALSVFDLFVTLLLLADSLFYKFFEKLIPLTSLKQSGQIGGVLNSLIDSVSLGDVLLFGDFLFIVPLLLMTRKRQVRFPRLPRRARATHALAICSLAVIVLAAQVVGVVRTNGTAAFSDLYSNHAVLNRMGILGYHGADLYNLLADRPTTAKLEDTDAIKAWMMVHRSEGSSRLAGVAKDKNVIMIQMEALQGFLLGAKVNGQEITPNLNRFLKSSMYFDNYFPQIGDGNTSDAEFMSLNSLYPLQTGIVYMLKNQNTFQSLPKMLKDAGYVTTAFHNYTPEFFTRNVMYPHEGIDHYFANDVLKSYEVFGMGMSDESMYDQAVPILKSLPQPFFSFLLTLSGHHPYILPDNKRELTFDESQYSEMMTKYIHVQHYADKAFGKLLDDLKTAGLLDRSLLVVYGDHFGAVEPDEIAKFLGMKRPVNDRQMMEIKKVPLLVHFPDGANAGVQHVSAGQMDLYPTLANLLGLDKNKMFYFGQDVLNAKDGFTAFRNRVEKGTFFTNELFYHASDDGVFEHGICTNRNTDEKLPVAKCQDGYQKAMWEWSMSDLILKTDGLPKLLGTEEKQPPQ